MTVTGSSYGGQTRFPDGRVSMDDPSLLQVSDYANPDLQPVPIAERRWGTYNYTALWVGMAHNIPS